MKNNCRTYICNNPNSKYKGILNLHMEIGFVFYSNSENCYWPVNSSYYELMKDGWIEI